MLRTWTGYQNKVAWQGIRTQITGYARRGMTTQPASTP
jgi:hypothetical protein